MTSLFWAESSPGLTYVLEIGEGFSRLIIRTKRTMLLNRLAWVLALIAYLGIFIAIAASPPYQAWAPWRYPGVAQAIVALFALGGIIHMTWSAWWVPRFSIANPARIVEIQIQNSLLGRFAVHKIEVKAGDEMFPLTVRCPRRRLAKTLRNSGLLLN